MVSIGMMEIRERKSEREKERERERERGVVVLIVRCLSVPRCVAEVALK